MASGQKIRIIITGIQYPVGVEDEPVTAVQEVEAEYFRKADSHYLFYTEQPEGFPAPLRTRIKSKGQTLEIHRQGFGGSTMLFAPGQIYRTEYPTPYGVLLLDIVTSSVTVNRGQDYEGVPDDMWSDITVEYTLQNDGEDMARYCLSICKK